MMLASGTVLTLIGCADGDTRGPASGTGPQTMATVSTETWTQVGAQRVFLGHQSVGQNVLDGVRGLQKQAGGPPLVIHDLKDGGAAAGPALLHAHIGENGDPLSKIRAFKATLEGGLGRDLDVAAFKFCFWDIQRDTDVGAVFEEYERTMRELQAQFPTVRLVHITVPLFGPDTGWRADVRRLLGRPVPRNLDNARRHELSELIRRRYRDSAPIFDLAAVEAEGAQDGGVPYLLPEYTYDGGHLNESARARAAAVFLSTVAAARTAPQATR